MSEIRAVTAGLLPNPFNTEQINSHRTIPSSFSSSFNVNQGISSFLPWYNASNNLNSAKIEDPTIKKPKWEDTPVAMRVLTPKPFQKQGNFSGNTRFYCDTCDRPFHDEMSFLKHQSEHTNCNIQGCKFRAHPKIVALHKKMQHQTGLAKKIMSLDTPDDIQKWRLDRKKNFPTAKNIEKRKREIEEKRARGEILGNKYFGKMRGGRGRGGGNRFNNQRRGNDETCKDTNHNGQGRFRGRSFHQRGKFRGNLRNCPERTKHFAESNGFAGTNILKNYDELMKSVLNEIEIKKEAKLSEEQSEGELDSSADQDSNVETISSSKEIQLDTKNGQSRDIYHLNNKIDQETNINLETKIDSLVTNAYKSNIEPTFNESNETKTTNCNEKKETITQEKMKDTGGALSSLMANYGSDTDSENEPVEVPSKIIPKLPPKPKIETKKVQVPNLYPTRKRQTSLLEKLLANEIRHERNIILQCVHHIVENNFFECINVENKDLK